MTKIEEVKMLTRETDYPYFDDEEIERLLEYNRGNVKKTAYQMLLIKAESSEMAVSGLSIKDSSAYWMRLAQQVKPSATRIV